MNDVPLTEPAAKPSRPVLVLQFSLASLLLIVTLCSVLFAGFAYSPCLGTLFGLLAAPAALYTVIAARRRLRRGKSMSAVEKTVVFGDGLGKTVIVIMVALLILYFIVVPMLFMLGAWFFG